MQASRSPSKPLHETSEQEWDDLHRINVKSVYWTTKFAFEALAASNGAILNTASMVGLIGQENHAAYVATKGAMISLTKAMAADYARHGIRVNAVCPAGSVDTDAGAVVRRTTGSCGYPAIPRRYSSARIVSARGRHCGRGGFPSFLQGTVHHRLHPAGERRSRVGLQAIERGKDMPSCAIQSVYVRRCAFRIACRGRHRRSPHQLGVLHGPDSAGDRQADLAEPDLR